MYVCAPAPAPAHTPASTPLIVVPRASPVADKAAAYEDVTDAQLAALASERLPLDPLRTVFAGVHALYVAAVRQPALKANFLKEDLKELKMPAELAPDFVKIVEARCVHVAPSLAPSTWWPPVLSVAHARDQGAERPSFVVVVLISGGRATWALCLTRPRGGTVSDAAAWGHCVCRREAVLAVALAHKPAFPTLARLRWRVDVAISTSALSRVLRPTVLMELTLSDGRVHAFEVPLSQFHELRYSVAAVLKDMDGINQKSIFKIKD
jgi:hypothetical protein